MNSGTQSDPTCLGPDHGAVAHDENNVSSGRGSGSSGKRKMTEDDNHSLAGSAAEDEDGRRRKRNEREQKRSAHISEQFDALRDLMVHAGVIVPQGTRATILSAATQYIDLLQEKERKANEERERLSRELQIIQQEGGSMQSSRPRNVSHDNVTNFVDSGGGQSHAAPTTSLVVYSNVFRKSPVAMAIAGLGGFFFECNEQFHRLTGCENHEELLETSIFSLIDDQDMATALDRITNWLMAQQPPTTTEENQRQDQEHPNKNFLVLKSNVTSDSIDSGSDHQVHYQLCFSPIWEPMQTSQLDSMASSDARIRSSLPYVCVSLLPIPPVSTRTVSPSYGTSSSDVVPTPFRMMHHSDNHHHHQTANAPPSSYGDARSG